MHLDVSLEIHEYGATQTPQFSPRYPHLTLDYDTGITRAQLHKKKFLDIERTQDLDTNLQGILPPHPRNGKAYLL